MKSGNSVSSYPFPTNEDAYRNTHGAILNTMEEPLRYWGTEERHQSTFRDSRRLPMETGRVLNSGELVANGV